MKHLKLFEKENEKYWIVVVENLQAVEASSQNLFEDEESAMNYFIELINDEKERMFENNGKTFTLADVFVSRMEAEQWLEDNVFDVRIYYYGIFVQGKYEESDIVKQAKQTKKYNI
jgi:hypothetical protein